MKARKRIDEPERKVGQSVARVRHLNDKKTPDHWREAREPARPRRSLQPPWSARALITL